MRKNEIVVGLDGSPASRNALAWAVAEASRTSAGVLVVNAWMPVAVAVGAGAASFPGVVDRPEERRRRVYEDVVLADGRRAGVPILVRFASSSPTVALLEASKDARLLVVGSGRKATLERFMLGSTSEACAHQAPCPMVVVPGPTRRPDWSVATIVVGVDGSQNAKAAMTWAIAEAAQAHAVVEALAVVAPEGGDVDAYVHNAGPELEAEAASEVVPGVKIVTQSLIGEPAEVLCRASERADLLVVGRRGRGAVAAALLGSVADDCLRHAPCPVAIVPPA